jgi:DNA-binding transcriptional MocR family regulator
MTGHVNDYELRATVHSDLLARRWTCAPGLPCDCDDHRAPPVFQPPAPCGHHHLHRHVGPGREHQAVNLGQGFPDFGCDPLLDAVNDAMRAGHNQYPPMAGCPAARGGGRQNRHAHGRQYDAATEITITAGATQAILTAILATVQAATK